MKHEQLKFTKGFRVSVGNKKSQGAVMVLGPGDTEAGGTIVIAAPINGCWSSTAVAPPSSTGTSWH